MKHKDVENLRHIKKQFHFPWMTCVFLLFVFIICIFTHDALLKLYHNHSTFQEKILESYNKNIHIKDSLLDKDLQLLLDTSKYDINKQDKAEIIRIIQHRLLKESDENNVAQIKGMLEIQLDRIRDEYETLALWGGIITVVFLIFSFYSLFKTEDFTRQAQQTLNGLEYMREEAEDETKGIDAKVKQAKQDIDKELQLTNSLLSEIRNNASKALEAFNQEKEEILARMMEYSNSEIERINESRADLISLVNDKIQQIEKRIDDMMPTPLTEEEMNQFYKNIGLDISEIKQLTDDNQEDLNSDGIENNTTFKESDNSGTINEELKSNDYNHDDMSESDNKVEV